MIVGVTIGSGIFASPGPVLLQSQSVGASLLVWIFAGFLSSTGSLSYAELGTMISESGGDHPYLLHAFGEFPAFLYSWTNLLTSRPGSIAIILSICSEYLSRVFFSSTIPIFSKSASTFFILCLTLLNVKSTKSSGYLQNIMTLLKLLSLAVISVIGILFILARPSPDQNTSIFDGSSKNPGNYALAIYSALWAYDGWNSLNSVCGELKDPPKNLPKAITIGIFLVTLSYFFTNLAYFMVLSKETIISSNTVALDFGVVTLKSFGFISFSIMVILSTLGAANASILTGSRIFYVSSKKGHAPSFLSKIDAKTLTPVNALICQAFLSILYVVLGDFQTLINIYSFATWIFYLLTVLGLLKMRITDPFLDRPFKVWIFVPITFCFLACALLVISALEAPREALLSILFLSTGIPFYFLKTSMLIEGILSRTKLLIWPTVSYDEILELE